MPEKNYKHTDVTMREHNVGAITLEFIDYATTTDSCQKVRIYDGRTNRYGYGTDIFEGTIEELIKLVLKELRDE